MSQPGKTTLPTLPRELRDQIYELAFLNTHFYVKETKTILPPSLRKSTPHHSALLATSQQLRYEAAPYYYKLSTFYIDDSAECIEWYSALSPEDRGNIRELRCSKIYWNHVAGEEVFNGREEGRGVGSRQHVRQIGCGIARAERFSCMADIFADSVSL